MADLTIADPASAALVAAADVFKAVFEYAKTVRETASQAARDEQDRITAQAYWDWREFLQKLGIVGEARKG